MKHWKDGDAAAARTPALVATARAKTRRYSKRCGALKVVKLFCPEDLVLSNKPPERKQIPGSGPDAGLCPILSDEK